MVRVFHSVGHLEARSKLHMLGHLSCTMLAPDVAQVPARFDVGWRGGYKAIFLYRARQVQAFGWTQRSFML